MDLASEKFELADVDSLVLNYLQFKSLEDDPVALFHHSDPLVLSVCVGLASQGG